MFLRFLPWIGLGLATGLGCAGHGQGESGGTSAIEETGGASVGPLSQPEIESLLFMREEEKLARDVYRALDEHGNPFVNIQESEQRHMDAVLAILEAHGLADPAAKEPGKFNDEELQALYTSLVKQGSVSEIEALKVGCTIEELDIRDLELAKLEVVDPTVAATYENLLLGSRNHLRAFYGKLRKRGGSYVPQFIDQDEFDAIVQSPKERP